MLFLCLLKNNSLSGVFLRMLMFFNISTIFNIFGHFVETYNNCSLNYEHLHTVWNRQYLILMIEKKKKKEFFLGKFERVVKFATERTLRADKQENSHKNTALQMKHFFKKNLSFVRDPD